MTDTPWTPGPYVVTRCQSGGGLVLRGDGERGGHVQHSLQIVPFEDAVLFAAAPELVEVLDWAVASYANTNRGRRPSWWLDACDILRIVGHPNYQEK